MVLPFYPDRWSLEGVVRTAPTPLFPNMQTRQRPLAGLLHEKHYQAGSSLTTRITACTVPVFVADSCESLAQE